MFIFKFVLKIRNICLPHFFNPRHVSFGTVLSPVPEQSLLCVWVCVAGVYLCWVSSAFARIREYVCVCVWNLAQHARVATSAAGICLISPIPSHSPRHIPRCCIKTPLAFSLPQNAIYTFPLSKRNNFSLSTSSLALRSPVVATSFCF